MHPSTSEINGTNIKPTDIRIQHNGISQNNLSLDYSPKNESDGGLLNVNEEKNEGIPDGIDSNYVEETVDDVTDYPKLFEKYQERFHIAYSNSQKLFNIEQAQRETLNYYQRRNNALLDLLSTLENTNSIENEVLSSADKHKLQNIIEMNPNLTKYLGPLLGDFEKQKVSKNHKIDLLVTESIPELVSDDLKNFEVNPQDIDSWCRRYYPNLVISKFKPLNLKPIGADASDKDLVSNSTKQVPRKKRKIDTDETDEK